MGTFNLNLPILYMMPIVKVEVLSGQCPDLPACDKKFILPNLKVSFTTVLLKNPRCHVQEVAVDTFSDSK